MHVHVTTDEHRRQRRQDQQHADLSQSSGLLSCASFWRRQPSRHQLARHDLHTGQGQPQHLLHRGRPRLILDTARHRTYALQRELHTNHARFDLHKRRRDVRERKAQGTSWEEPPHTASLHLLLLHPHHRQQSQQLPISQR